MAKTRREVLLALGGLALSAGALAQMGHSGHGPMGAAPAGDLIPPKPIPLGHGVLRLLRDAHQDPGRAVAGPHLPPGLL
jgi:hypothetical protein